MSIVKSQENIGDNVIEGALSHARKSFETISQARKTVLDSSQTVLPEPARELNNKIFSYTNSYISEMFDQAEKLIQVKSFEELIRLQTDYFQTQSRKLLEHNIDMNAVIRKAYIANSNKQQ